VAAYIVRRLIQAVLVIFIVSIIVFLALRLLPGDPILIYISGSVFESASPQYLESLRQELGLDKPLVVQYGNWLVSCFQGDLGLSLFKDQPVTRLITSALPVTFHLGVLAFLISLVVGVAAGVISAVRRGSWVDTVVTVLANLGLTAPVFWVALMFMYLFGLNLRWLPVHGYTYPFDDFWLSTRQLIMPVFCLALFAIASTTRQTRSSMLEVIRQDYIRTARAKGLREQVIIFRHALKNGLIPVVTWKGMTVRNIFGGSVIIETIFNIPGMGRLAVDAAFEQDYAVVQGVVLVIAIVVTLANLAVDLSYSWLDPRIRYK